MKQIFFTLLFLFVGVGLLAQTGTISGTVIEKSTGDILIGANVYIEGTTYGITTDLDGKYSLIVEPGTYLLKISSLGFNTLTVQDVIVTSGKTIYINANLESQVEAIAEATVTAKASRKSATALTVMKRKSANLIDGISSETISKSGDATAAAAVKRVTGVSIEGGKYVYVRGLGDRYTKTTLNGMTIPGLNPDKNTVQMDLFPANLIDNIVVYKSFTPDLAGDFTGGLVDVSTKDFPNEKTFNVSLGYGYTTGMNFDSDFVLYDKGKNDWLGFAGLSRRLKFNSNTVIPDESQNEQYLSDLSKGFSRELGVSKGVKTFLNQKYSLSYGNQFKRNQVTFGLNLATNYTSNYTFYDDVYQGLYFKNTDSPSEYQLDKREVTRGSLGKHEVMWSVLVGGAMKIKNHKIITSLIHTQNGEGSAADYISQNYDETNATLYKDAIEYSQKSVTNLLLGGQHNLKNNKLQLLWKVSPTYSVILEPDVRSTRLSFDEETNSFNLQLGDGAGIDRYYRDLNELNLASKVDLIYNFKQWSEEKSKVKFGFAHTYKKRDYSIILYSFSNTNDFTSFTEDPNDILIDDNLWTPETQSGMYVTGNRDLNNEYHSRFDVYSAYAMNELPLNKRTKAIYGVRAENAKINYQGYYNNIEIDSLVHDELVFLPSLNLIYNLNEKMNLRSSYTKTVARPSFKEKSNAHIDDPISQTVFIGNLDLKETDVQNFDIRWEYFMTQNQLISFSGFYKNFLNPIELVPFNLSPNNIQPKNINQAQVYGGEFEFKKRLSKESNKFKLDFGTNFTYLISQVNTKEIVVNTDGKTEYDLRVENARTGEIIKGTRVMQGQAPYIINASLNFKNDSLGLEANISYNVQGERLAIVGSGIVPDVYEDPFHSLNLKLDYVIGQKDQMKIGVSAKNILGDNFEKFYKSYQADNETFRSYSLGRSFGITFNYRFL